MATTTDTSRRIAETVKAALREAGITQEQAALRSGMSPSTLERRLAGSPFTTVELEMIADVLGVSVFALIYRAEGAA